MPLVTLQHHKTQVRLQLFSISACATDMSPEADRDVVWPGRPGQRNGGDRARYRRMLEPVADRFHEGRSFAVDCLATLTIDEGNSAPRPNRCASTATRTPSRPSAAEHRRVRRGLRTHRAQSHQGPRRQGICGDDQVPSYALVMASSSGVQRVPDLAGKSHHLGPIPHCSVPAGTISALEWEHPDSTGLPQQNRYFDGTTRLIRAGEVSYHSAKAAWTSASRFGSSASSGPTARLNGQSQ
jgi:hypothetical protein